MNRVEEIDVHVMQTHAQEASGFLKTLANPSRLLVLCALVTREHTAGELEALTDLSQSAISQHLAKLREAKMVSTRREAQRIFYALSNAEVRVILQALYSIYCSEDSDA
jgi:DNA-binding transcriptional ArsR family regulator